MRKPILRIVAIISVATVATVIAAQELEDASVVRTIALTGARDFRKAVENADANYFKRLSPSVNRLQIGRCRAIIATCKKTITALKRIADDARRTGSDLEAAIAKNKIATVKEYLAKAEADMPKDAISKPVPPVQTVRTIGARVWFGRHSYLVVLRQVTWDQARRMAESHGGYLASVGSAQELMFLKKFAHIEAWVGGCPGSDPVQWQWLDGKKVTDTFWKDKKPKVESNRRIRLSNNGLSTETDTRFQDAFIIEWDR